ncbi:MAG: peptidoglycan-binding protein, partial [Clostridia bacterium]
QDGIAGPATLSKLAQVLSGATGNNGSSSAPQSPSQSGSSSAPITTTLKLGSRGSQVVTLQKRLNELGYNCGTPDGIFGSKTQQAVIAFQKDNGLVADGIVGPKTIAKLFPAQNQNPNTPPSNNNEPSRGGNNGDQNTTLPITTTLKLGSRGSQVVTLQKRLNELGYNCGTPDGIFGSKTQQAVIAFQKDNGLVADGIVGPKTIAKLFPAQLEPQPQPKPQPEPQPESGFTEFHGTPGALAGKVIFVDAGHGGTDSGAARHHEGYGLVREKDLVLDIAKRLKRILEEAGATVILTRPDDKYYSLFYRSALVNTYILQTELASVEKAKDEALQAKRAKEEELARKEREKVQKEADIDRYEAELEHMQNELSQNEARLSELQYALIQAENDLIYKQNDYQQKYAVYQSNEQRLKQAEKELEDLKKQRDNLQKDYDAIVIDVSDLVKDADKLEAQLTALEKMLKDDEKKAALLEQINQLKAEIEAKVVYISSVKDSEFLDVLQTAIETFRWDIDNNLKSKLDGILKELAIDEAEKQALRTQLDQIKSDLQKLSSVVVQKKSLKQKLDELKAQVLSKEGQVNQMRAYLDMLIEVLKLDQLKAEWEKAQAKVDEIKDEIEDVALKIETMKIDIINLENAKKDAESAIIQLENEIPLLNDEILALEEDIEDKDRQIEALKTRIEQFKPYLDDPNIKDRMGIYSGQLKDGKRYATSDLVEVFDLTLEKYQDNYLFISLHCNSTAADVQTTASGISVFYRDNGPYAYNGTYGINVEYYTRYNAAERERFAKTLLQQLNATTNFSKKYTAPYKADFSVLRENNLISVLVEVGFINNPNDRALLIDEQTREDVAAGIYKGIVEYYKR